MDILTGSICLTDIKNYPELIKVVSCKDGVTRKYLNISVIERKEPSQYGKTHFISCAPKKDERQDGKNYILGDLKRYEPKPQQAAAPTPAPTGNATDDLPF